MNHRGEGSSSVREQRSEVTIEGKDAAGTKRCLEYRAIARITEPQIANMLHIINLGPQQFAQVWGQAIIQKQLQLPDARGNCLSLTASAANRRASGMSSLSRSG